MADRLEYKQQGLEGRDGGIEHERMRKPVPGAHAFIIQILNFYLGVKDAQPTSIPAEEKTFTRPSYDTPL